MSDRYLVMFDTDHIKEYVFASGRLKEIRGASSMIRSLTDHVALEHTYGLIPWNTAQMRSLEPGEPGMIIYAGGAAGAVLFPEESEARAFCRQLEETVRRTTVSASLTAVAAPVYGLTDAAEAEAQRQAVRQLQARKVGRPLTLDLPGGTLVRFCASDRLNPALINPEPTLTGYSRATARKRQQSADSRHQYATTFYRDAFLPALRIGGYDVAAWDRPVNAADDLSAISSQSTPSGYLALLYADGDAVGRALRHTAQAHGFAGYHAFSVALSSAASHATAMALAQAYAQQHPSIQPDPAYPDDRQRDRLRLPFEIITIGGDDVILVCTAERALDIAVTLSQVFTQQMHQAGYAVSASVGVVISHDSMPIVQLRQRAFELLRSAKRVNDQTTVRGGIDFHIVTTPGLDAIEVLRDREYQIVQNQSPRAIDQPAEVEDRHAVGREDIADQLANEITRLTLRPYSAAQMAQLLDHARSLRGRSGTVDADSSALPGTKRAALYEACQGPRTQATMDVLTIHTRLKPLQRRTLLNALRDLDSLTHYPFRQVEQGYATALLDLLEASEFVAERAGSGGIHG